MKKKLVVLLALIMAFTLCFAGCGGSDDPAPAPGGDSGDAGKAPASDGKTYTLVLTTHDNPGSATATYLETWKAKVEEESGGRLIIDLNMGGALAGPKDTIDYVLNGTADLGWGLQSFYPGVFPMTDALSLPLLGLNTAEQASRVLWDLYDETDFLKAEYEQFKVILLRANNDCPISSPKKKVETGADLAGMNIRALSGPPNDFIISLGASPVDVSIGEVYSALENSTLDATITDWHAVSSFKLYEPAMYFADEAITTNSYFFLMNQDSYDRLPADLQQVIDNNSGDAALEIEIDAWDKVEDEVKALIKDTNAGEIYNFGADARAELEAAAAKISADWIKKQTDAGYPAQDVYDKVVELAVKYAK